MPKHQGDPFVDPSSGAYLFVPDSSSFNSSLYAFSKIHTSFYGSNENDFQHVVLHTEGQLDGQPVEWQIRIELSETPVIGEALRIDTILGALPKTEYGLEVSLAIEF